MKVLHFADTHEGAILYGHDRSRASEAAYAAILEKACEIRPDIAVCAGDLFHARHPRQSSRERMNGFLCSLAEVCPVLAIAGNHDDAMLFAADRRPFSASRVTLCSFETLRDGNIVREPSVSEIAGLRVLALPWLPPAFVRNLAAERECSQAAAYRGLFNRPADLAVAHGTLSGARAFNGSLTDHVDPDFEPEGFGNFHYVALGHIHMAQADGVIRYSGSPFPLTFEEAGAFHGFCVADLETGRAEEFPCPETESLVTIRTGDVDDCREKASKLSGQDRPSWIRVVWTGLPRENLRQDLEEACEGFDLLCVQDAGKRASERLEAFAPDEELSELDPPEVFERMMEAKGIPADGRMRLRRAFRELLEE